MLQLKIYAHFQYRYAFSAEAGEDGDDEEAQSLTKGISDGGDLGLVKMEKKERNIEHGDDFGFQEDEAEEDKREWLLFSHSLFLKEGAKYTN